ncbi:MAG: OmpH family outer membrane protein [Sphingobacteriales bacterium JAD_PAG50586_3]|nr:MAG: OmpH family outer membrane protein [Sphingobacteriales bacterium JAD_PAG50586_3]
MKNLSLILNGVLVIAVAVLFYLHFTSAKGGAESVDLSADTTVVNAKGKAIVYVDSDSLLKGYDYSKKVQDDLAVKKTAMENTIKGKQTAFDNKLREYQTKMDYLTPAERAKTENDLKNMQMDGEKTMYDLQGKFQTDAAALNEQLLFKVEDFLKGYAKANGHIYVIQTSRGIGPVLYGDPQLNVTSDVINKLNEVYKKELEAGGTK